MFDLVLPQFYTENQAAEFFNEDIRELNSYKTADHFEPETLNKFVQVSDELEASLLEFTTAQNQKVTCFNNMKKQFHENNEILRSLNDQLVIAKIEKKSFGLKISNDEYDGVIIQDLEKNK